MTKPVEHWVRQFKEDPMATLGSEASINQNIGLLFSTYNYLTRNKTTTFREFTKALKDAGFEFFGTTEVLIGDPPGDLKTQNASRSGKAMAEKTVLPMRKAAAKLTLEGIKQSKLKEANQIAEARRTQYPALLREVAKQIEDAAGGGDFDTVFSVGDDGNSRLNTHRVNVYLAELLYEELQKAGYTVSQTAAGERGQYPAIDISWQPPRAAE